ncbi:protein HEG homolog 1 isoform X4 [Pezoporus flaviventris]|uniref:protein HEG homolog 1 isoform X4 n=1 Tax=Pezoporus flaviventris TaxID=889875 RepID=UPI002AB10493|nr:protein HEG homolog 1 isoform X4 [Pezoporus flaviventris]
MPAACTLLLLLGLGPVLPTGSLPLASLRRLPSPPPPSRSRFGRPSSPPAAGHAGSPVIDSSHQESRSSYTEIRTSGALMDSVELMTTLAGSREHASLPARHGMVPAVNGVMGHSGPHTSSGDITPLGAGPPESPSAGTATHLPAYSHHRANGSHHHSVGSWERDRKALGSASTPAAAESTVLAAISTDSVERMLGTSDPLQLLSSWIGKEPSGSPPVSTAATSPSPSGSSGGTLLPVPSTPFPDSPGQPQSSPQASSQTVANSVMLHPRNVIGNSTSPSRTASPAMDSTFGAAGSSIRAAENLMSSIQRVAPGSAAAQPLALVTSLLALAQEHFPRPSTEHGFAPSHPALESTAVGELAIGSSYQPSNSSATERRISDFLTTSTSISTTDTKGGGRMLRSLPASTRLADAAEISTSGTEMTSSSAQSQSLGMSLGGQYGGGRGATDLSLVGSSSALESTSPAFSNNYDPKSVPAAEEAMLRSDTHGADLPSMAAGAPGYPTNGHTTGMTEGSANNTNPTSSSGETFSSSGARTHHPSGSQETSDLPMPPREPLLTSSFSASESVRSSHQPVDSSATNKNPRASSPTSTFFSAMAAGSSGRSPRSATSSSRWTAEVSTATSGMYRTLGTIRSLSTSSVKETYGFHGSREITDFTEWMADSVLTRSRSPSDGPSLAEGTLATGGCLPNAPLTSTPSSVIPTNGGERSTVPVSDTHAASNVAGSSASASPHTSSFDVVLLPSSSATEPGRQSSVSQSGAGLAELPTKPLPAFSPSISVPLPPPSVSVPEGGRTVSGAPTDTVYISTTLSSHKEGTSQAVANHGTWSTAAESPMSHTDMAREPRTSFLPSSTAWPGAGHFTSSQAGYLEPKVTLSSGVSTYFSVTRVPSAVASSHHSLSSLSAEERMPSPITDPVYSSSRSAGGGERTLHSVTDGVLAGGTGSSASYAETDSSPAPAQTVSAEQSGTVNASASRGFATETLFTRSSKLPTYSSVQNDLTSFSSSHQPVNSIDAEKRTSVSHTDGTYISTTYTRGGERTLLSISNSSTSADSSESSTFFPEISNPSDPSKSSVALDRRNNVSREGSFVEPSTEPLLVHSSKQLTSASAGSVQHTTLFNTDSGLMTTGRSSISSSAFPAPSSLSSLRHSLSSTPAPNYLFTSSESSEPLLSSVMASSSPLQALSSSSPTSSLFSPSYSLASLLPLFSSPSSVSQSNDSNQTSTSVATTVVRRVPSTAAVAGSSHRETKKHNVTHQPRDSTTFTSTGSLLPTAPMEQLGGHIVSVSDPVTVTETTSPRVTTSQGGSFGKATPLLTTASDAPQPGPTEAPHTPSLSATNHSIIIPVVVRTTVKPALTTPASHPPTPGDASTTKDHRAQTPAATKRVYTISESTEAVDPTTARLGKVTEESILVTSPSEASPTSKTTVSLATTLAATKATTVPPSGSTPRLRMSSPATDVDKCLSNPCPALATCNNTHGSYICQCPLGYELEKGKCNLVRIFIGQVPLKLNITHGKYAELLHVEGEILAMLDASLSGLPGYHHSTVKATRETNFVHVSVQSTFSLASNVTLYDVVSSVKSYIRACKSPTEACQFISSLKPLHRVGSLCKQKDPECDKETSECTDFDGVALCQCKSGYFKYNKMDHSCRACEDGYKLENETCVSCPFGLGGFNCGNPYQLITVVIAAAGGGLLLIMGIALIVTCCRKNKNDISKLIFKSGDFQMSPYAEYPKNPRAQEWGRETIEMQENGSTKNLLQMTDVYYSPTGLRNPELERNGLYPPYTGLPGSRHSCIYPGQYNPSFISDETRRRDYF